MPIGAEAEEYEVKRGEVVFVSVGHVEEVAQLCLVRDGRNHRRVLAAYAMHIRFGDGHTASLFLHGAALHEQSRWVTAEFSESVSMWRITLTLPLINASRHVLFLVAGADKADVVQQIIATPTHAELLPAARVAPTRGILHWIIDGAAAAKSAPSPTTNA